MSILRGPIIQGIQARNSTVLWWSSNTELFQYFWDFNKCLPIFSTRFGKFLAIYFLKIIKDDSNLL